MLLLPLGNLLVQGSGYSTFPPLEFSQVVLGFDSGLKAVQLVYSKIFYLDFSCSCCLFQSDVRCFLRFGLPPIAPPRMLAIIRGYPYEINNVFR